MAAVRRYRPRRYAGEIDLFIAADFWHKSQHWCAVADRACEHYLGDFDTNDLLIGSHVPGTGAGVERQARVPIEQVRDRWVRNG